MFPFKRCPCALAAPVLVCLAGEAHASFTFTDIEFWVGAGSNEAAFVLDWNDGITHETLAWGYRWDGSATGEDMLRDVVTADINLYAKISSPGDFGISTFGFGYDNDGDGFGIDDGTMFGSDGIAVTTTDNADGAMSLDPDDHYQEGWFTDGFWTYWTSDTGSPYDGGSWSSPSTGVSDRVLVDGSWDGFSFDPAFSFEDPPSLPVAATVPAPGALALIVGAALPGRRRRR